MTHPLFSICRKLHLVHNHLIINHTQLAHFNAWRLRVAKILQNPVHEMGEILHGNFGLVQCIQNHCICLWMYDYHLWRHNLGNTTAPCDNVYGIVRGSLDSKC